VPLREKRLESKRGERRSGWKEEESLGISVVSMRSEGNRVLQQGSAESTEVDLKRVIEKGEEEEMAQLY